ARRAGSDTKKFDSRDGRDLLASPCKLVQPGTGVHVEQDRTPRSSIREMGAIRWPVRASWSSRAQERTSSRNRSPRSSIREMGAIR
ncbi:MAG: hypothetical protein P8020_05230, partial [Acidobacteriota bacterium]